MAGGPAAKVAGLLFVHVGLYDLLRRYLSMEVEMIVYKTTCLKTGKIYIGQHYTEDDSYLGSGVVLLRAIAKYGPENFKRETLARCSSVDELNEQERYWIEKLDALNPEVGYNMHPGGQAYRCTDDIRQKMSAAKKGRKFSEDHRRKLSEAAKRRAPNIKKGHKFGPMSDEEKAKRSRANKGRRPYEMTDETRQRMSEAAKGRVPWNKGLKSK